MAETTAHEQIEPAKSPATPPVEQDTSRDTPRFDPWVGIGYHVIQVLFVVIAFVIATRLAGDVPILTGRARTDLLFVLGYIGLPAIGVAIALRLGQLDLSVGAMATFAMGIYVANEGGSSALVMVMATAVLIGAVTGAVSGALRIPAWLSTLALSFVLLARFFQLVGVEGIPLGGEPPSLEATPAVAVMFFAVGLGAAAVFLVLDLIRRPGQVKRIEDVALGYRILLSAGALVITTGLAAYTGVMQAERLRFVATPGFEAISPVILAAVLIGGVGVFGARVSLVGTMLGAAGMALIMFGIQLSPEFEAHTRLYASAIPLAIFVILRGVAAVLRRERIPA
jgi:ribose/xylose/arabinose/galactoside ABC-type transport system permease subunit